MNEGAARFAARYPIVWHVIETEGAGPWLPATGLLPATSLLHLAGIAADGANRDDFQRIAFGDDCTAILRQQVMPDRWLTPTLSGAYAAQPAAWRSLVNAHVFFWTEQRRRDAFIRACLRLRARSRAAPGSTPPRVLTFETAALLGQYRLSAFFTRINTGSTVRGGARARRDESTFTPVARYRGGAVAEMAIRGRVMLDAATRFEHLAAAASPWRLPLA
ncbi:MAG TPA: hypothetical protein VME47_00160 [Acetobacteraceae bacterium]|nr:hypothetical protein [Acetobacteraceae bacterium]